MTQTSFAAEHPQDTSGIATHYKRIFGSGQIRHLKLRRACGLQQQQPGKIGSIKRYQS
jgi:hypothetical protein